MCADVQLNSVYLGWDRDHYSMLIDKKVLIGVNDNNKNGIIERDEIFIVDNVGKIDAFAVYASDAQRIIRDFTTQFSDLSRRFGVDKVGWAKTSHPTNICVTEDVHERERKKVRVAIRGSMVASDLNEDGKIDKFRFEHEFQRGFRTVVDVNNARLISGWLGEDETVSVSCNFVNSSRSGLEAYLEPLDYLFE